MKEQLLMTITSDKLGALLWVCLVIAMTSYLLWLRFKPTKNKKKSQYKRPYLRTYPHPNPGIASALNYIFLALTHIKDNKDYDTEQSILNLIYQRLNSKETKYKITHHEHTRILRLQQDYDSAIDSILKAKNHNNLNPLMEYHLTIITLLRNDLETQLIQESHINDQFYQRHQSIYNTLTKELKDKEHNPGLDYPETY